MYVTVLIYSQLYPPTVLRPRKISMSLRTVFQNILTWYDKLRNDITLWIYSCDLLQQRYCPHQTRSRYTLYIFPTIVRNSESCDQIILALMLCGQVDKTLRSWLYFMDSESNDFFGIIFILSIAIPVVAFVMPNWLIHEPREYVSLNLILTEYILFTNIWFYFIGYFSWKPVVDIWISIRMKWPDMALQGHDE